MKQDGSSWPVSETRWTGWLLTSADDDVLVGGVISAKKNGKLASVMFHLLYIRVIRVVTMESMEEFVFQIFLDAWTNSAKPAVCARST